MLYYLTINDLRQRLEHSLPALYDDHGELNEDWLTADLETLEGLVNAHLARRYLVPVTAGADLGLLRGLVLDLAMELAHRRKASGSVPPAIRAAASRARETLLGLAEGRLSLAGSSPATPATAPTEALLIAGNPPNRARQHLAGY